MLNQQFAKSIRKAEWIAILRGLIVGWKFWAIWNWLRAKLNWQKIWQPLEEGGILWEAKKIVMKKVGNGIKIF